MKRGIKIMVLIVLLCPAISTKAQNVLIDGELRPRTEFQDGFKTPVLKSNAPGFFTSERTRLGLTFSTGLLTAQITLQDARVFGQYGSTDATASTGIYEAWADMVLFPGMSFKIGRQTVKYDDNRLFSAPAWNITGTTHDLALFKYSINDFQAHLGLAYNNKSETATEVFYTPGAKYRSMGYLWFSSPVFNGFSASAIVVDEGMQDTMGLGGIANYKQPKMIQTVTYGGNLRYESNDFPLSGLATAYFQAGKNVARKEMKGTMAALKLNYKFSKFLTASVGTDYFSGDDNGTTDGEVKNFRKLCGSDHTFNGYMDYWNTPLTTGLLDYYGFVIGQISKDLCMEGSFHVFSTEYAGKNKKNIAYGKNIGSEFDLLVNYKLNSWVSIQGGYCRYFTNNNTLIAKDMVTTANAYPEIRSPQWAYVMFTIKPTFFKTAP